MSELHDFNQQVISEFRANQGKVGGQLANMPVPAKDHPADTDPSAHAD